MLKRAPVSAVAPRPSPLSLLALPLALLPACALFAATLLGPARGYLLRRDENIMLAILAAIGRGDTDGLFLMSISPAVVAALRAVEPLAGAVAGGRALAMLSALACTLLTAAIARRLYGPGPTGPLAAAALLSSALFVTEGTVIRPNLAALALALGAVLALLVLAGLLYGLAVQVKALALAMAPTVPLLLWGAARGPLARLSRPRAVAAGLGSLAVGALASAALLFVLLGGGSRLTQILGSHLSAAAPVPLPERLALNGSEASAVLGAHVWLAVLFIAGALRGLAGAPAGRERSALLLVWAGGVTAMLLANFPSWDHHYVFLLPPLAVGAAALAVEAAGTLGGGGRLAAALALVGVALGIAGAGAASAAIRAQEPGRQEQELARLLVGRTSPGATVWSDNLILTLMAERPTEPALADLSMKRIIAGQLREEELFDLVGRREPAAIIYYDGLFDAFPRFTACLNATRAPEPVALSGQRVYWLSPGDAARVQACGAAPDGA